MSQRQRYEAKIRISEWSILKKSSQVLAADDQQIWSAAQLRSAANATSRYGSAAKDQGQSQRLSWIPKSEESKILFLEANQEFKHTRKVLFM